MIRPVIEEEPEASIDEEEDDFLMMVVNWMKMKLSVKMRRNLNLQDSVFLSLI